MDSAPTLAETPLQHWPIAPGDSLIVNPDQVIAAVQAQLMWAPR